MRRSRSGEGRCRGLHTCHQKRVGSEGRKSILTSSNSVRHNAPNWDMRHNLKARLTVARNARNNRMPFSHTKAKYKHRGTKTGMAPQHALDTPPTLCSV